MLSYQYAGFQVVCKTQLECYFGERHFSESLVKNPSMNVVTERL